MVERIEAAAAAHEDGRDMSIQVICPGFAADCLETLEEIAVENRDYFLGAGGERYQYIPCLNNSPAHIDALADITRENLTGWLEPASAFGTPSRDLPE